MRLGQPYRPRPLLLGCERHACGEGVVEVGAEAIHGVPDAIAAKARTYLTPDLAKVLTRFERAMQRR